MLFLQPLAGQVSTCRLAFGVKSGILYFALLKICDNVDSEAFVRLHSSEFLYKLALF